MAAPRPQHRRGGRRDPRRSGSPGPAPARRRQAAAPGARGGAAPPGGVTGRDYFTWRRDQRRVLARSDVALRPTDTQPRPLPDSPAHWGVAPHQPPPIGVAPPQQPGAPPTGVAPPPGRSWVQAGAALSFPPRSRSAQPGSLQAAGAEQQREPGRGGAESGPGRAAAGRRLRLRQCGPPRTPAGRGTWGAGPCGPGCGLRRAPPRPSRALPPRRHLRSVCLSGRSLCPRPAPPPPHGDRGAGRPARAGRREPCPGGNRPLRTKCTLGEKPSVSQQRQAPAFDAETVGAAACQRRRQTRTERSDAGRETDRQTDRPGGEQVFAGLEEQARQAMMKTDFPGALGDPRPAIHQLQDHDSSSSDSDEEETTQDEASSHTSEEDRAVVKVKKELENTEQPVARTQHMAENEATENLNADPMLGLSQCPLCQLECGSREQLIAHVYQHTAAVVSAKSYMCPVCGRALSSPGSLGRHLLIHSEDQLSNCAVCGARFTTHATFHSEKLPEVLTADHLPTPHAEGPPGAEGKDTAFHGPVYPAGVLLVCNNCAAYRKLLEAQAPGVRKWALRRQNEPLEVRLQRLERERTAKKSRRDNETPEEREVRRMRDREAKRLQRMQETDEQRARRLQRDREAMRLKRANETPEKRQARLIREREAKRLKRRLEKMDMMLRAQFGQDSSAMAALAAEMNFFQLPVGSVELESQLLGKMAFEEQSNSTLH